MHASLRTSKRVPVESILSTFAKMTCVCAPRPRNPSSRQRRTRKAAHGSLVNKSKTSQTAQNSAPGSGQLLKKERKERPEKGQKKQRKEREKLIDLHFDRE